MHLDMARWYETNEQFIFIVLDFLSQYESKSKIKRMTGIKICYNVAFSILVILIPYLKVLVVDSRL